MARFPQMPAAMKPLQRYLKTADEFDKRDALIAYYCRFYAAQLAVQDYGKDKECVGTVMKILDAVEEDKAVLKANDEERFSDVVAQVQQESTIWNVAMTLFARADSLDREGKADKRVVKSFFTSMSLFEVLRVFGELDPETEEKYKYARWKAAYITRCLREGLTPVAGPVDADGNAIPEPDTDPGAALDAGAMGMGGPAAAAAAAPFDPYSAAAAEAASQPAALPQQPAPTTGGLPHVSSSGTLQLPSPPGTLGDVNSTTFRLPDLPDMPDTTTTAGLPPTQHTQFQPPSFDIPTPAAAPAPAPAPAPTPAAAAVPSRPPAPLAAGGAVSASTATFMPKPSVSGDDEMKATKFCKFAISALQYNDVPTAVSNLQNALRLLAQ